MKDIRQNTAPKIFTILFGHIGDTLIALSFFDDIISVSPETSFTIITKQDPAFVRDLASAYPNVKVERIPRGFGAISFFLKLLSPSSTFLALGLGGALKYSLHLKIFLWIFSKIPGNNSLGLNEPDTFPQKNWWQPLNKVVKSDQNLNMLQNFRKLLPKEMTAQISTRTLHLKLNTSLPKDFPYKKGEYIVAHLFGVSRYRSLPIRRWKTLLNSIAQNYPNLPIVFTGAEKDREMINEVAQTNPHAHTCIGLPILQVAGIIDATALYIGVDTGITHLASVLKQKSLVIRHVGDMRWAPTYNPNARILINTKNLNTDSSINDISDKIILDSVRQALSSGEQSVPTFGGIVDENSL